eukprot:scaffold333_cov133-Cylindrotheca_fusiformis.AAC.12
MTGHGNRVAIFLCGLFFKFSCKVCHTSVERIDGLHPSARSGAQNLVLKCDEVVQPSTPGRLFNTQATHPSPQTNLYFPVGKAVTMR